MWDVLIHNGGAGDIRRYHVMICSRGEHRETRTTLDNVHIKDIRIFLGRSDNITSRCTERAQSGAPYMWQVVDQWELLEDQWEYVLIGLYEVHRHGNV